MFERASEVLVIAITSSFVQQLASDITNNNTRCDASFGVFCEEKGEKGL